ncbi:YtxH domain-containing protein [Affinibrenneria salicis]|uniref:YtxH domain-containing protein n=1 Tax=Affinibrenneria salicis TaxID=2590031 RepID=A0A5J5FX94_9GAMM|nr:YtxH domain-containing protein [Affinibrenneria salicis]KAA8998093.1 YtxH domain-containing protein [Affinibrenneria salicis]
MKNNNQAGPFFYGYPGVNPYAAAPPVAAPSQPDWRQTNSRSHFISGLVAGAAVAYLLSNSKVQQGIGQTAGKAWHAVRGEMEELKERLADVQAELDYYRNRDADNPQTPDE